MLKKSLTAWQGHLTALLFLKGKYLCAITIYNREGGGLMETGKHWYD